jgi:hypothetical protein
MYLASAVFIFVELGQALVEDIEAHDTRSPSDAGSYGILDRWAAFLDEAREHSEGDAVAEKVLDGFASFLRRFRSPKRHASRRCLYAVGCAVGFVLAPFLGFLVAPAVDLAFASFVMSEVITGTSWLRDPGAAITRLWRGSRLVAQEYMGVSPYVADGLAAGLTVGLLLG